MTAELEDVDAAIRLSHALDQACLNHATQTLTQTLSLTQTLTLTQTPTLTLTLPLTLTLTLTLTGTAVC